MPLAVKIKAGAINNLSDARYFAVFAEWVGFCFDTQHAQHILPISARELMGWIVGPRIVAECGTLPLETINHLVSDLSIDVVQADYDLDRAVLHPIVGLFIRRIAIEPQTTPAEVGAIMGKYAASNAHVCFLLDFNATDLSDSALLNNAENNVIWSGELLQKWCSQYQIIFSLPAYTPHAVLQLINYLNPLGIEFLGETEQVTGIKSFENLNDIIDVLDV